MHMEPGPFGGAPEEVLTPISQASKVLLAERIVEAERHDDGDSR